MLVFVCFVSFISDDVRCNVLYVVLCNVVPERLDKEICAPGGPIVIFSCERAVVLGEHCFAEWVLPVRDDVIADQVRGRQGQELTPVVNDAHH